MSSKNSTTCIVLVTYNRRDLLLNALNSIFELSTPVSAITIINNNSSDDTENILNQRGIIKLSEIETSKDYLKSKNSFTLKDGTALSIEYIRTNENLGSAGGFRLGLESSFKNNYDWYWLMDDDITVTPDSLEKLIGYGSFCKCIQPSKNYFHGGNFKWNGFIDESYGRYHKKKEDFSENKSFTLVNYGCFEGMFVHHSIIKAVGFPNEKYFFICDDTDFGFRISKVTNIVYIQDQLLIKHIDKTGDLPSVLGDYLLSRNQTNFFVSISHNKILTRFNRFVWTIKNSLHRLLKLRLYKNSIWIIKGYFDGILGIFGREKELIK